MTHPYDTQLAWRFNPSDTLRSMINSFCNVAEDYIKSANPSESSVNSLNVAINELLGNFEAFKSTIDKLDKNIDDDAYNAIHNCFAGALLATSKIANFATLSDDNLKMFGAKVDAARGELPRKGREAQKKSNDKKRAEVEAAILTMGSFAKSEAFAKRAVPVVLEQTGHKMSWQALKRYLLKMKSKKPKGAA